MVKHSGVKDDFEEPLLFRIDSDEHITPLASKAEWELWMEEKGKRLRGLIRVGKNIAVGVKFVGEQAGWGKTKSPLLWQAAVLIKKRAIATIYAETYDEAVEKIYDGLSGVVEEAPWKFWIQLKWLLFKLRWKKGKMKADLFRRIS